MGLSDQNKQFSAPEAATGTTKITAQGGGPRTPLTGEGRPGHAADDTGRDG